MYALEKVRYEFNVNKNTANPETIAVLTAKAQENLDIVKRQVGVVKTFMLRIQLK